MVMSASATFITGDDLIARVKQKSECRKDNSGLGHNLAHIQSTAAYPQSKCEGHVKTECGKWGNPSENRMKIRCSNALPGSNTRGRQSWVCERSIMPINEIASRKTKGERRESSCSSERLVAPELANTHVINWSLIVGEGVPGNGNHISAVGKSIKQLNAEARIGLLDLQED
nr:hypothetical protein Iba_chr08aCG14280 [Ipomoea batatas]